MSPTGCIGRRGPRKRKEKKLAKEKAKRTKPTVQADIKCPHCEKRIHVEHFRQRVNPSIKAEYKVWTEVRTQEQQELFEKEQQEDPIVTARE